MRIDADRERCIGAGMCALTAPRVFDQDEEDGTVLVLDPAPEGEAGRAAGSAARLCPSSAITVRPGGAPAPR
ncbi:ferredoxin [Nocardiopsis sp. CNT-189]|uniref:ferredoxin n=1 Tax=Nocardiopsis oceanisediminis TaxID=2816862 RepID=UPI003B38A141